MKSVMERLAAGEGGFTLLDELHMGILEERAARLRRERARPGTQARAQQGLAPAAGLARFGRGPDAAQAQVHHLHAVQRQHRPARPRWPSAPGCPGTACSRPKCSRPTSPIRAPTSAWPAVFDVTPSQVMLAAAHHDDLAAARACGLRTGYIERPSEFGADAAEGCLAAARQHAARARHRRAGGSAGLLKLSAGRRRPRLRRAGSVRSCSRPDRSRRRSPWCRP